MFDFENFLPETASWLRHAATHLSLFPPRVIRVHVLVYTPWLPPTHPKTPIYLLDVSPSTTAFALSASTSPIRRAKILSFHDPLGDRVAVLSFHGTGPDSTRKIHARREGCRFSFLFFFLFVIPSLDRWMRALNIQREGRLFFFFFFFFLHPPGGWETHSGLKHSDERWFRCTREQREETGRNGVGVRSLSPSLLPPSQPPRARPSPDRRGGACAWPSVGVADATTFEARVCFRGKLDIEPIFLPSRFLSIKKLRLFLC